MLEIRSYLLPVIDERVLPYFFCYLALAGLCRDKQVCWSMFVANAVIQ